MSKSDQKKKQSDIKIKINADKVRGEYFNLAAIHHSQNEFVLDFVFRLGAEGDMVSRLITSPSHAKALLVALEDNIGKYETKFGELAPEPQPQTLH